MLEEKYGISNQGSMDEIRKKLDAIVYSPIPVEEFERWKSETRKGTPWNEDVQKRYSKLLSLQK